MKLLTPKEILENPLLKEKKHKVAFVLFFIGWIVVGNLIGHSVMSWWIDSKIETYVQTHQCGCR